MPGFVFVSYSRSDTDYATRMVDHQRGEHVLRDQVDAGAAMIVVMSPAVEASARGFAETVLLGLDDLGPAARRLLDRLAVPADDNDHLVVHRLIQRFVREHARLAVIAGAVLGTVEDVSKQWHDRALLL